MHYREYTPLALWARMLVWAATFGIAASLLIAPPASSSQSERLGTAAALLCLGLVIEVVLNGLTVHLTSDQLTLHLGRVPVIRKRIPLARIQSVEAIDYRPLREFGGWGVRGFGKRQAWTARGNRAVRLTLDDAREIYVGSDDPRPLAERVRTAIATAG